MIAGGDVRTRERRHAAARAGRRPGRGTTYDGAHIGAFGVPVCTSSDPALGYSRRRAAAGRAGEPRRRVAGGDVTGDYMVRNGEATLLAGYALPAGVDEVGRSRLARSRRAGRRSSATTLRQDLDVSALAARRPARLGRHPRRPDHRRPGRGLRRHARAQWRRGAHRREPEPRLPAGGRFERRREGADLRRRLLRAPRGGDRRRRADRERRQLPTRRGPAS